jgi:hypothetical protein
MSRWIVGAMLSALVIAGFGGGHARVKAPQPTGASPSTLTVSVRAGLPGQARRKFLPVALWLPKRVAWLAT